MGKRNNKKIAKRIPRPVRGTNVIHSVHRAWSSNIPKIATDSGVNRSFNLNTFPASDIISLFQEYRIKSIMLQYTLVNAPNNNADFPAVILAPQRYNIGGVTPANRDEVLQYKGVTLYQTGPSKVQFKKSYVPYVQMTTSGAGVANAPSPWLSTQSASVPHLISVEWIDRYNSTSSPTHTLQIMATAVIECRGTR